MTEIAVRTPSAITPAGIDFTEEQMAVIKNTIAKGASDAELALFVSTCRRTGLDPFLKQIYCIGRRSQVNGQWVTTMTTQVGIDGMRLIADRTGKYGGQDPIEWLDQDGAWTEVWTARGSHPVAARCSVYRKDWGRKATAVVRWDSYAQESATWKKMPDVMLGKCAESLALRRAFPAEMSGLAAAIGGDFDTTAYEVEASERERRLANLAANDRDFEAMQNRKTIDAEIGYDDGGIPDIEDMDDEPVGGGDVVVAPADEAAKPPAGWKPRPQDIRTPMPTPVADCDHDEKQLDLEGRLICSACGVLIEVP